MEQTFTARIHRHLAGKVVAMAHARSDELQTIETRMAADSVKGGAGPARPDRERANRLRGELAVIDDIAGALTEIAAESGETA